MLRSVGMCHKCRGGAGRDEVNCFRRRRGHFSMVSVAGVPSMLLRHNPGDTQPTSHEPRRSAYRPAAVHKTWHWQGNFERVVETWHRIYHHMIGIIYSDMWIRQMVRRVVFKVGLTGANIQKVSIHAHFRTPAIPEKGNRKKKEKLR